jgi:hypothetical protein
MNLTFKKCRKIYLDIVKTLVIDYGMPEGESIKFQLRVSKKDPVKDLELNIFSIGHVQLNIEEIKKVLESSLSLVIPVKYIELTSFEEKIKAIIRDI